MADCRIAESREEGICSEPGSGQCQYVCAVKAKETSDLDVRGILPIF